MVARVAAPYAGWADRMLKQMYSMTVIVTRYCICICQIGADLS